MAAQDTGRDPKLCPRDGESWHCTTSLGTPSCTGHPEPLEAKAAAPSAASPGSCTPLHPAAPRQAGPALDHSPRGLLCSEVCEALPWSRDMSKDTKGASMGQRGPGGA